MEANYVVTASQNNKGGCPRNEEKKHLNMFLPMIGCPPSNRGGSHWTTQESSPTLRILGAWGGSGTSGRETWLMWLKANKQTVYLHLQPEIYNPFFLKEIKSIWHQIFVASLLYEGSLRLWLLLCMCAVIGSIKSYENRLVSLKLLRELCLTDNFHIDICSVLPSRVPNHNRVDSLVLPLSPLDGEDTVPIGGFNMDPTVSLWDDLDNENQSRVTGLCLSRASIGKSPLTLNWLIALLHIL